MAGPVLAERGEGGTPWHAHHVAERYGLLAIISVGEILIGTVAALNAVISLEGWTFEIVALGVLGVALAVGLWWTYFNLPAGEVLHHFRERSFVWGYGHLVVYGAIAAVGAGLHVAALFYEQHAELGQTAVMATIAVPTMVYLAGTSLLFGYLVRPAGEIWLVSLLTIAVAALSIVVVAGGVALIWGIAVVTAAPWLSVIASELGFGSRVESSVAEALSSQ